MDLLREIVEYVAAQTALRIGGGTNPREDDRLYAGYIPPDKPDVGAVFRETGGPDQLLARGQAEIGRRTVQVLARGPTYFRARGLAWQVHDVLHGAGVVLGDHFLHACEALASPQALGQDEKGRHLFSTNYVLRAHDDSLATP